MIDKRQLLCTFSNLDNLTQTLNGIKEFYDCNCRLFIFVNVKNPKELFITYNIINYNENSTRHLDTILVHRKKYTNTLYTLNAMNQIIRDENGGILDKSFRVNWELYKDSLILTNEIYIKIISIKLYDIIC
jgi:hypothetical protein